jgi:FkbM family methyltransferase
VAQARVRFARELADGRVTIVHAAIDAQEGTRPFWICDATSHWNSFDREIAGRDGSPHHAIEVRCRTLGSIVEQFGVPHYLKVDIEGADHLCVEALQPATAPRFLSIEQSRKTLALLPRLQQLGYVGFKCISQRHYLPLQLDPTPEQRRYERLLRLKQSRALPLRVFRRLGGKRWIKTQLKRTRIHGDWVFPGGSSGPFGDDTLGQWQDFDQFSQTLAHFQAQRSAGRPSLFWDERSYSFWADLHARRA